VRHGMCGRSHVCVGHVRRAVHHRSDTMRHQLHEHSVRSQQLRRVRDRLPDATGVHRGDVRRRTALSRMDVADRGLRHHALRHRCSDGTRRELPVHHG
jgi:hypothetical protein